MYVCMYVYFCLFRFHGMSNLCCSLDAKFIFIQINSSISNKPV